MAQQEDTTANQPSRGTDQAALLGVGLAATIGISASEGPWELIESLIGFVLLVIIVTYYTRPTRKGSKNSFTLELIAVAGVEALCVCIIAAFWIQQLVSPGESSLANIWLPAVFFVSGATCYLLYTYRQADDTAPAQSDSPS